MLLKVSILELFAFLFTISLQFAGESSVNDHSSSLNFFLWKLKHPLLTKYSERNLLHCSFSCFSFVRRTMPADRNLQRLRKSPWCHTCDTVAKYGIRSRQQTQTWSYGRLGKSSGRCGEICPMSRKRNTSMTMRLKRRNMRRLSRSITTRRHIKLTWRPRIVTSRVLRAKVSQSYIVEIFWFSLALNKGRLCWMEGVFGGKFDETWIRLDYHQRRYK